MSVQCKSEEKTKDSSPRTYGQGHEAKATRTKDLRPRTPRTRGQGQAQGIKDKDFRPRT